MSTSWYNHIYVYRYVFVVLEDVFLCWHWIKNRFNQELEAQK